MAVGSNVNPNFPIPGLDQSSKGFRDNFATIKKELESLQGTSIQLAGDLTSNVYVVGESETLVVQTFLNISKVLLPAPEHAIQYNKNGALTGNVSLVFDEGNVSVGIGSSIPNPDYSLDAGRVIRVKDEIVINQPENALAANLRISTANTTVMVSNYDTYAEIGSESNISIDLITGSESRIHISHDGNVGINTTNPLSTLHVMSNQPKLGTFYSTVSNDQSIVRVSTGGVGSTVAVGLENIIGNTLAGIRLNQQGTLSFHSGEFPNGTLDDSTAKLVLTKLGKVGIGTAAPNYTLEVNGSFKTNGITDVSTGLSYAVGINKTLPVYALDVRGDIATGNAIISTVESLVIDTDWITLDAMPITTFRSAKYIVQVSAGSGVSEEVNIIECFMTHINGTPYLQIVNQYQFPPPGSSLGSLQAIIDPVEVDFILLQYSGASAGNTVRISKTYILD